MKRKTLEKTPVLYATDEMVQLVREDIPRFEVARFTYSKNVTFPVYKRYIYFRSAPADGGVLMVSMYFRKELENGITEPHFNIFLDRDRNEYETYDLRKNQWRKAGIESLYWDIDIREKGMEYENIPYSDKSTKDMVNRYLGAERQEVKNLIQQFQNTVRKEKLNQKHKRESDEIDEEMALVPKVPDDFKEWIEEYGFYPERYIFYHAEGNKQEKPAYCVQCGSSFMAKQPRRGNDYKCPVCKKTALLCSWKSKDIHNKTQICLIQRLTDGSGWVTRRFAAHLSAKKDNNWKRRIWFYEEVRELYDDNLFQYQHYEYGRYKSSGIQRWCYSANEPMRKSWYYNDFEMGEARVYWKNLCWERKGTILQYIPLEKALRQNPGVYIQIHRMMNTLKNNPEIEYFIKMGFKRMTIDIINGRTELKKGKKPWEVLGITKELMQDALKYDVSWRQLEILRSAGEMGYRLEKGEVLFYSKYFTPHQMEELIQYATPHKMYRYFTEVLVAERLFGDYLDYLEAAQYCRWDMKNEMVLFPKHFRQAHDAAVEEKLEKERKIEDMQVRQKNKEYAKMVPELKELYEYEDDKFFIKIPEKKSDFTKEGHMNHNCVGTYFDKVLKGKTVVVFMRRKELPDQSYCTVEITNTASLQQLRSDYNRQPPEEAKEFAEKWIKEVKKRMAKKEAKERRVRIPVEVAVG